MESSLWHFRQSLALRPLLWIAPVAMAGSAWGAAWAALPLRENAIRNWPLLWLPCAVMAFSLLLCGWALRQKYFWMPRVAGALALCAGFFIYSAWRVLPPSGDISQLVHDAETAASRKPSVLQAIPIHVRGYVAEAPHVTDYTQEFPLQSTFVESRGKVLPWRGNIWIQAPLDQQLNIGDRVEIHAALRDLPEPGTDVEANRRWRYILHHCWSMIKLRNQDSLQRLSPATAGRFWPGTTLDTVRQLLLALYQHRFIRYDVAYPRASAQLMVAMVFGDGALRTPLPPLVRRDFRAAGLTHLLVASGTQISLLVVFIIGFLNVFGLRRFPWLMLSLLLLLLAFYALLVGGAASIWRAFIAGFCVALALLLGRPVDMLSLWGFAATALLAIDPLQIFDLSFQLTFAATWGLIAVAPHLQRGLQRHCKSTFVMSLCGIGMYTLAAQLAVFPLLIYHFDGVSLAGLFTNFAGIPLAGLLVGSGILSLPLPWLTGVNAFLTHCMSGLASGATSWNALQLHGITLPLSGIAIYYAALCVLPRWDEVRLIARDEWHQLAHRWQFGNFSIGSLRMLIWGMAGAALLWSVLILTQKPTELRVAMLDVGQGECIFIQTPSGHNFLIDGGTLSGAEHGKVGDSVIVPYLQAQGVRRLDAVLLTHPDADHCNALDEVTDEVPVQFFLDGSGQRLPSGDIKEPPLQETDYWILRKSLQKHRVPRRLAHAGQRIELDDHVVLQILSPLRPALAGDNNHSMAIKLIYGNTSFLFTGDMEKEEENQLLRRGINLRCTILKVAHHGSATSSTAAFLRAAHPAAAIISCGRYNPFGHPAADTLQRFKEAHIPLFRTDLNGTIEIRSDGKRCQVSSFR